MAIMTRALGRTGANVTILAHLASNISVAEKGPLPPDLYEEAKKRLPDPAA